MSGDVHSSIVCHIQPFYKFPAAQNREPASFVFATPETVTKFT